MDIRKLISLFPLFVFVILLNCHIHLSTNFEIASSVTKEFETASTEPGPTWTKWVEQQINGTINICSDILGTLWRNETDKPLHEIYKGTFNVCVPKKVAFHEFVDVDDNDELKGGFSIAIFCLALQELPFKILPIFKPIEIESYNEIVQKLESKDCNAVAGDITITSNRTTYADFTIPYMGSELYMLVPATRSWDMLTLLKPFSMTLWFAIIIACIIIGISIEFLEYRVKNPIFYHAPVFQKLFMIIWFPVSEVFFQKGEIINKCSKVVLVTWLIVIFIVIQIYTASLSTWLTVNQLQPKVPKEYGKVGYQNLSYVVDFIHANLQHSEPIALSGLQDYKTALKNGTIDAICDEHPYIDIFLAEYGETYKKFGPVADEPGLGFAFSRGSLLQQNFSNAIVKVMESPSMAIMKEQYLGIQTSLKKPPSDYDSDPQSLDVHSFFFVFLFMAFATTMAIIVSEISLMRGARRSNEPGETPNVSETNEPGETPNVSETNEPTNEPGEITPNISETNEPRETSA